MPNLNGKVAVVTGASYGVGKGVALALAEGGATVYATGRTVAAETFANEGAGGAIVPLRCDHTDDAQVEAAFGRVTREQGRLDVLVNSAWGGYEDMLEDGVFTWTVPFWRRACARRSSRASTRRARWWRKAQV